MLILLFNYCETPLSMAYRMFYQRKLSILSSESYRSVKCNTVTIRPQVGKESNLMYSESFFKARQKKIYTLPYFGYHVSSRFDQQFAQQFAIQLTLLRNIQYRLHTLHEPNYLVSPLQDCSCTKVGHTHKSSQLSSTLLLFQREMERVYFVTKEIVFDMMRIKYFPKPALEKFQLCPAESELFKLKHGRCESHLSGK